jgi:hypothetical protein
MPLFHVENLTLDDNIHTDFGADSMLRGSFSGLYPVGPRGTGLHTANGQRCNTPTSAPCSQLCQGERCSTGQLVIAAGARVGGDQRNSCQPAAARGRVGRGVAEEGSSATLGVQMAVPGLFSPQKIQETGAGGRGCKKLMDTIMQQ